MYDLMGRTLTAGMHVFRGDCYTNSHRLGWVLRTIPGDGTSFKEDKVKVNWQIDGQHRLLFKQPWLGDRKYFTVDNVPLEIDQTSSVGSRTVIIIEPETFIQAQSRARAVAHITKNPDPFARLTEQEIRGTIESMTLVPESIPL